MVLLVPVLHTPESFCRARRNVQSSSSGTLSQQASNHCPKATRILSLAYPLPGHPKHTSRMIFYAATVLLKYLDSEFTVQAFAQDEARNAFQQAHLFFRSCSLSQEHLAAGNTLEIAGRAIGNRQAQVPNQITTRMGASIIHNITWLGGLLRGRDKTSEYATNPSMPSERVSESGVLPLGTQPLMANPEHGSDEWDKALQATVTEFPFGVWDDALYDGWLKSTSQHDISNWSQMDFWSTGTVT